WRTSNKRGRYLGYPREFSASQHRTSISRYAPIELEQEIISGELQIIFPLIRRSGTNREFRGENLVPGKTWTGTHENALGRFLKLDLAMQAEGFPPIARELDAV